MSALNEKPLISIITPLYNKEKYIKRALGSVFKQSYGNFEAIVIDDGSSDSSAQMVSDYEDSRIRLVSQENTGPGAARNRGIHESKGKYLAFIDADDEWLPKYLEKAIEAFNDSKTKVVVADFFRGENYSNSYLQQFQDIKPGFNGINREDSWITLDKYINLFHSSSVVISKDELSKYSGFYEKNRCTWGEDSYLWIQVILNNHFFVISEPLTILHYDGSELGYSRKTAHPPRPMLYEYDKILNNTPKNMIRLVKELFNQYTLHCIMELDDAKDFKNIRMLLNIYPLTFVFNTKYIVFRMKYKYPHFYLCLKSVKVAMRAMKEYLKRKCV